MSANDIYRIFKKDGKFLVYHTDMDGCYNTKEGEFETLKEANTFARREASGDESGYPSEYGVEIDDNCFER